MKASNLVLTRRPGSTLEVNFEGATVTILFDKNGKIIVQAPPAVQILRGELAAKMKNQRQQQ